MLENRKEEKKKLGIEAMALKWRCTNAAKIIKMSHILTIYNLYIFQ